MRRCILMVVSSLAITFSFPANTVAQDTTGLRRNALVRVIDPGAEGQPERVVLSGRLHNLVGDTAIVQEAGQTWVLVRPNYRLEIGHAVGRKTGKGALIGLGIGAFLPWIIPCEESGGFVPSCNEVKAIGSIVLGALGTLVGAAVGSWQGRIRWQPVEGPWKMR